MAGLLRPDSAFVGLHPDVVQHLGSTAANVLSYIAYVEGEDGARLTAKAISDGTGVTVTTVKRTTTRLRQQGLLSATRASSWDAALVWHVAWDHPVIAGQPESATVTPSRVSPRSHREHHSGPVLYSEQEEQLQEPPAADAPGEEQPAMPVPDSEQVSLFPAAVDTEPQGPPKTAQTLVARWCDGYRASNTHDAPGPLVRRVAGQMKALAKACGDSHDDWVSAWSAAYDCGAAGRWDPVGFMSRRQHPGGRTTNAFVSPALGGPGAAAVSAVQAMLAGPRELGS